MIKIKKHYVLKSLRTSNNINQKEMANKLGMPVNTYCGKENGQRKFTLDEAFEISNILNKDIKDIFFCSNNSQKEN